MGVSSIATVCHISKGLQSEAPGIWGEERQGWETQEGCLCMGGLVDGQWEKVCTRLVSGCVSKHTSPRPESSAMRQVGQMSRTPGGGRSRTRNRQDKEQSRAEQWQPQPATRRAQAQEAAEQGAEKSKGRASGLVSGEPVCSRISLFGSPW
jgi:hypothetical protein